MPTAQAHGQAHGRLPQTGREAPAGLGIPLAWLGIRLALLLKCLPQAAACGASC